MGPYANPLVVELVRKRTPIWLESALHIKRSLGILRGKSDKADSRRIATYAYQNQKSARLWQPPREVIEKLKLLRSLHNRLLKVRVQLETAEGKSGLYRS